MRNPTLLASADKNPNATPAGQPIEEWLPGHRGPTPRFSGWRVDARKRLQDVLAGLAGAHPVCLVDRQHEHLAVADRPRPGDRKSTRLNSSHANISYALLCLKKKQD